MAKVAKVFGLGLTALLWGCSAVSPLASSEPWHTPKYPPHGSAGPTVAPSAFASGPAYDWESPMKAPWGGAAYHFSNPRTYEETTAWIKKTIDSELAKPRRPDQKTLYSDFHFEGCTLLWHEEQWSGKDHVNAYSFAVNLAKGDLHQMFGETGAVRVGWDEEHNSQFQPWDRDPREGKWTLLGGRLETWPVRNFPVSNREIAERLAFAFRHAARLCGAKVPEF